MPDVVSVAELFDVGEEGHVAEGTGGTLVDLRHEKTLFTIATLKL